MFPGNMFYGIRDTINMYCERRNNSRIPFSIVHGIKQTVSVSSLYLRQPLPIWCNSTNEADAGSKSAYGTKALGSPFLYHLVNAGIKPFSKQPRLGSGILVLPTHSVNHVRARQDHENIIDALKRFAGNDCLREVTVHLYGLDMAAAKFYRHKGVRVATSGYILSQDFFPRFTQHALKHSIVVSNYATSGLFYCAALGLKIARINTPDNFQGCDPKIGAFDPADDSTETLWQGLTGSDWLGFAEEQIGLRHLLNPAQMRDLFNAEHERLRIDPTRYRKVLGHLALHSVIDIGWHTPMRGRYIYEMLLGGGAGASDK